MYPARVSSNTIRALIRELSQNSQLPSGVMLRTALQERYGCKGGVTRIYRLLAEARVQQVREPIVEDRQSLEREMGALRVRAEAAEHREQVHQSRWATEIDQLRLKVAALEPLAQRTQQALSTAELLRRQLHAAHVRIALLEQQLLEERDGLDR